MGAGSLVDSLLADRRDQVGVRERQTIARRLDLAGFGVTAVEGAVWIIVFVVPHVACIFSFFDSKCISGWSELRKAI